METTRLFYLLLTIWTTLLSSTWAQQPGTNQPLSAPPPTLATLDLTDATKYRPFITNMRNIFSEKKNGNEVLQCTMKKISAIVPSPRYAYIDIKASTTVTVTLAIDRTNLYVLGYRDQFSGSDRAFFFKEVYDDAKDLFPNAQGKDNRVKLGYTSQYGSLGDRATVPLGIESFRTSIANIYGKKSDAKFITPQKKFFLHALQMVAEATRFKYISDKIPTDEYKTLTVDEKVMALENGWDRLSTAVYSAKVTSNTCELLTKPVSLDLNAQNKWNFNSVEEIAEVVGILKAKGKTLSTTNYDGDSDDPDAGGVVASS